MTEDKVVLKVVLRREAATLWSKGEVSVIDGLAENWGMSEENIEHVDKLDMEYEVNNMNNSELKSLMTLVEHELHLSETCIEEGEEKRE